MDSTTQTDFSKPESPAISRAVEYGIDISLLEENLRLSPIERLRRHDDALNFSEELEKRQRSKH